MPDHNNELNNIVPKKDEMTADILDVLEGNLDLKQQVLLEISRK